MFMIAPDVLRGQRFLGEFVPPRSLDVQAFAGGENLPAQAGAVGGVVGDEEGLAVLRDESGDVHLALEMCILLDGESVSEVEMLQVGCGGVLNA